MRIITTRYLVDEIVEVSDLRPTVARELIDDLILEDWERADS